MEFIRLFLFFISPSRFNFPESSRHGRYRHVLGISSEDLARDSSTGRQRLIFLQHTAMIVICCISMTTTVYRSFFGCCPYSVDSETASKSSSLGRPQASRPHCLPAATAKSRLAAGLGATMRFGSRMNQLHYVGYYQSWRRSPSLLLLARASLQLATYLLRQWQLTCPIFLLNKLA